jgi:ABC-type multidrug transport system fused ATPase/permease subunit
MDKGHIIERGNHAALLEMGGRYSEMWQMQQTNIESNKKIMHK